MLSSYTGSEENPHILNKSSAVLKGFISEKISIIIPVRNEAANLGPLLCALERLQIDELIVVDGGSRDQTEVLLQSWAKASSKTPSRIFIVASSGRALQMNAGAKRATGDILLFLHADTNLPPKGIDLIRAAMKNKTVLGGAFRLHIDSRHPFIRWVCWIANLRSIYWRLPYGDQAIFVRRDIFEKLGGYPLIPLMEDVAFIRRLKKRGRIIILKEAVITSARRWRRQGYFFTSFRNMLILLFYFLGVSPKRLAKWYDSSYKT